MLLLSFSVGVLSTVMYERWANNADSPTADLSSGVVFAASTSTPANSASSPSTIVSSSTPAPLETSTILSVNLIEQLPELNNGCEVSSLAMLLQYDGFEVDKMELVQEMKLDPTPLKTDDDGNIISWGNPNSGFVGDVTGKQKGYGIYHAPLFALLKEYIPTAVDLTGQKFQELERQISQGIPVVAWVTVNYQIPTVWINWETPQGPFRATLSEHCVLITGYDSDNVYVNDPLSGSSNVKVNKKQFEETWKAMGSQAISYEDS